MLEKTVPKATSDTVMRFVRNFAIFFALLITCAGGLGYIIIQGEKDNNLASEWVLHTHNVIVAAEELSSQMEGLLSAQRGYLLARDPEFLENYEQKKLNARQNIEKIQDLVRDNPAQAIRIEQLRVAFDNYANLLETRITQLVRTTAPGERINLKNASVVRDAREEVMRLNNHILRNEYDLMGQRLVAIQNNKETYLTSLVLGGGVSLTLLLILNSFLLYTQSKRSEAERNLEITQERLNLAVRGARDGIFDRVWYSLAVTSTANW